jgi:hypothetical protein
MIITTYMENVDAVIIKLSGISSSDIVRLRAEGCRE